jgi:putative nucleotidyltransferase with HDIG domain
MMAATYSYQPANPNRRRQEQAEPVSPPELAVERPAPGAHDIRLRLLSAVNAMPPLPAVLGELLGILNDDDCSSTQIAAMIERDSVLSGSVLRCVNSAFYGVASRVSSIRHAVTLLGFATVRNLALAFSMRRMMQSSQPNGTLYATYSRHALACALMTQFLAHFTRSPEQEAAFAAGLFHDIGKLLVFTTTPELVPRIMAEWNSGGSYQAAESEILGVTHSELSAAVIHSWKLPEEIELAVRCHHDPASAAGDGQSTEPTTPPSLSWLLHAANAAVKHAGFEAISSRERPPEDPLALFEQLSLGDQLPEILQQFESQFEELQGAFG